jgi:hypothetical protein
LHKIDQHVEGLWPQGQYCTIAAQASRPAIDDKSAETIAFGFRQV